MQAMALQVISAIFFYYLSLALTKDSFGLISWANAVTALVVTLLSLGLDNIVARRVAISRGNSWPAAAFFFHALAGVLLTSIALYAYSYLSGRYSFYIIFLYFCVQGLLYISSPLRLYLNATERFTPYGIIAICSNTGKVLAAIVLHRQGLLSVTTVAFVLIGAAFLEWLALMVFVLAKVDFSFKVKRKAYSGLIREALPQYFSVLFDSGLSRMDWILLGILASNAVTGDYSFAYRGYEMARLPLMIISPLLLPKFARIMANSNQQEAVRQPTVKNLFIMEQLFAACLLLVINILWEPVISFITHGKYGISNSLVFLLLSLCLPLHFMINYFWTICFNAKKFRQVSVITVVTSVVNLFLNICLINIWQAKGAALAFLAATLLQAVLYYRLTGKSFYYFPLLPGVLFIIAAVISFALARWATANVALQLAISVPCFLLLSVLSRQVKKEELLTVVNFLKK